MAVIRAFGCQVGQTKGHASTHPIRSLGELTGSYRFQGEITRAGFCNKNLSLFIESPSCLLVSSWRGNMAKKYTVTSNNEVVATETVLLARGRSIEEAQELVSLLNSGLQRLVDDCLP
jgi:hypothetical protein